MNTFRFTEQETTLPDYVSRAADVLGMPRSFLGSTTNSLERATQEQTDREEKFKEFVKDTQNRIVFNMFLRRTVSLVSYYETNMSRYKGGKLPRNKGKNLDSFITACLIQKKKG